LPTDIYSGKVKIGIGLDPDTIHSGFAAVLAFEGKYIPFAWGILGESITDSKIPIVNSVHRQVITLMQALSTTESYPGSRQHINIAVESQEVYAGGLTRNPRDLLPLAQVAGALLGVSMQYRHFATFKFPKPAEWKGQVPKNIHHNRIASKLDIPIEAKKTYTKPTEEGERRLEAMAMSLPANLNLRKFSTQVKGPQWSEVLDAFGLAIWAAS